MPVFSASSVDKLVLLSLFNQSFYYFSTKEYKVTHSLLLPVYPFLKIRGPNGRLDSFLEYSFVVQSTLRYVA